jgi:hypothetical protein
MNIEELKLVLETVQGLGESAYWVAVMIIAKGYFDSVLTITTVVVVILFINKTIRYIIGRFSFGEQIKAIMGYRGEFLPSEKNKVLKILRNFKEQNDPL